MNESTSKDSFLQTLKVILGWGGGITTVATILFMGVQVYLFLEEVNLALDKHNEILSEVSFKLVSVHDRQDEITVELGAQTVQIGSIIDTDRERFEQRENRFEELETMHSQTWTRLYILNGHFGRHSGQHQSMLTQEELWKPSLQE